MRSVDEESPEGADPNTSSHSAAMVEISFDGLRSAISPISLMFDGRLFKDLKGLFGHVTHAMKKVAKERPDYQGALTEINLLEATFNAAFDQWEKKLTGEIHRLKTSIGTAREQSLGATKQINKYQAELNRGRASTRSMPNKTSQVRNQLIAASGLGPIVETETGTSAPRTRLSRQTRTFPVIYTNSIKQILRRAKALGDDKRFGELALSVFKSVSKPVRRLGSSDIHQGVLYYLHPTVKGVGFTDELSRQKTRFVVVTGMNRTGNAYLVQSVFQRVDETFEIPIEDFEMRAVDVFEPLGDTEVIFKLLKSKFKEDDLPGTFKLYYFIRKKALEDNRNEKFNPKQLAIHQYLTELIFDFVGIAYDNRAAEIRLVGEINNTLQRRKEGDV